MLKAYLSALLLMLCLPAVGQRVPNIDAGPLGPWAVTSDIRMTVNPDTGSAADTGSWSVDGNVRGALSFSGPFVLDLGTGLTVGSHTLSITVDPTADAASATRTFTVTVQPDTLRESSSLSLNTQTVHQNGTGTMYLTTSCSTMPCGSGGLYVDATYIGGFPISVGGPGGGKNFPVNAPTGTSSVWTVYADGSGLLHTVGPVPLQVISPVARVPNIQVGRTVAYAAGTDVRLVVDADYQAEVGNIGKVLDGNWIGGGTVARPIVLDLGTNLSQGTHSLTILTDGTPDIQGSSRTFQFEVRPDDGQGGGTVTVDAQTVHQKGTGRIVFSRPCTSNCGDGSIFVDNSYIGGFTVADGGTAAGMTYPANSPLGTSEVWVIYTGTTGLSHIAGPALVQVVGPPARIPNMSISPSPTSFPVGTDAQFTIDYDYGTAQSSGLWVADSTYMGGFNVPGTNSFSLGSGLSPGVHTVTIRTEGTPEIQQVTQTFPIQIGQASASSLFLTCSPSSVPVGSTTSCTITLTPGYATNVTLSDGSNTSNVTLDATGHGVMSNLLQGAAPGTYTLTASYAGDGSHPAATSVSQQVVVYTPQGTTPPASGTLYSYKIVQSDGKTSGFDGVGNVTAYNDSVNGRWTAGYDSLNRIVSAGQTRVNNTQQNFCWQYDSFGNRTTQAVSDQAFGASCQPQSNANLNLMAVTYNANNQITSASGSSGYVYDAAGNVINDGRYEYLYDGEGRLCASRLTIAPAITGYLYNAEGQRVAKGTLTTWTCDPTSLQITNEYILGLNGEQVTELDGNGNLIRTNVHADGKLIATYDSNGALHYHFSDWLGTRRVQVSSTGAVELACSGGTFGDQQNCTGPGSDATNLHFTGKERDTESGMDYFGARYYSSNMGRMMSPDPSGLALADITNPQSFNLYSYVLNNPLSFVDPNGLECVWDDGSFDSADDKQTGSHGGCSAQGGTYVDPKAFSTLGAGDWSNKANSDIAGVANALNESNNFTNVSVNANGSGYIDQTAMALSGGIPYIVKNDYSWNGDTSLALATGVMSQGIPKICAIGVTATLRKNSVGASVSGSGVGGTVNGHSSSGYTPQAGGVDMRSASPLFKTVPVGVYLSPNDPKGNSVSSVSADGTVKKAGVTAYVNLGTYTPNLSDPQNCP